MLARSLAPVLLTLAVLSLASPGARAMQRARLVEGSVLLEVSGERFLVQPRMEVGPTLDGMSGSVDAGYHIVRAHGRPEEGIIARMDSVRFPWTPPDPPSFELAEGDELELWVVVRLSDLVASRSTASLTVQKQEGSVRLAFEPRDAVLPVGVQLRAEAGALVGLDLRLPEPFRPVAGRVRVLADGVPVGDEPITFDPRDGELERPLRVPEGPLEVTVTLDDALQRSRSFVVRYASLAAGSLESRTAMSLLMMQPQVGGDTDLLAPEIGFHLVGGQLVVDHGIYKVHASGGGVHLASKIWIWRQEEGSPFSSDVEDAYLAENLRRSLPSIVSENIDAANGAVTQSSNYEFKAVVEEVLADGRKCYWTCTSSMPTQAVVKAPEAHDMPLSESSSLTPPVGAYAATQMDSLSSSDLAGTHFLFSNVDANGNVVPELLLAAAPGHLVGPHVLRVSAGGPTHDRNASTILLEESVTFPVSRRIQMPPVAPGTQISAHVEVRPESVTDRWIRWYHTAVAQPYCYVRWPSQRTWTPKLRGALEIEDTSGSGDYQLRLTLFPEAARPFHGSTPTKVVLRVRGRSGAEKTETAVDVSDGRYGQWTFSIPEAEFDEFFLHADVTFATLDAGAETLATLRGWSIERQDGARSSYFLD